MSLDPLRPSPPPSSPEYDLIVVGSGNAGFAAALSAAQAFEELAAASDAPLSTPPRTAPRILLIDKAPPEWKGGNTYFTAGAFRTVFGGLEDLEDLGALKQDPQLDEETEDELDEDVPAADDHQRPPRRRRCPRRNLIDISPYPATAFLADLLRVTANRCSPILSEVLVNESRETIRWLASEDGASIPFRLSFERQAYKVGGRYRFWGGMVLNVRDGGKGLVDAYEVAAKRRNIEICYSTTALSLETSADAPSSSPPKIAGLRVCHPSHAPPSFTIRAPNIIFCSGGFESSASWRRQHLGEEWGAARVRGTPYNEGDGHRMVLHPAIGGRKAGHWQGCHATVWDAGTRADRGDRVLTNQFTKSGYPLGLMVNSNGQRFADEGADMRNYTYAEMGHKILRQPSSIAFQVWDTAGAAWLRSEEYADGVVQGSGKITASSIQQLAEKLAATEGLADPIKFVETIDRYNAACYAFREEHQAVEFDPSRKDGLSTQSSKFSLEIPKSNWATPLDKPPFLAVKVTAGITFTFGGIEVDASDAGVVGMDGVKVPGLWAAGELAGGVFWGNYPGGSGLTWGAVMGRKAGRAAAQNAWHQERPSKSG